MKEPEHEKNFENHGHPFLGLAVIAVIVTILLILWMDRWGATDNELLAVYPRDELVPQLASFVNRAVTVKP